MTKKVYKCIIYEVLLFQLSEGLLHVIMQLGKVSPNLLLPLSVMVLQEGNLHYHIHMY